MVSITRWWAGRDNATLPEATSSHANCLKTRRLPPHLHWRAVPVWLRRSPGDRVHYYPGDLPGRCVERRLFTKSYREGPVLR
jgi:hypothetical protein